MSGLINWILANRKNVSLYLVHDADDRQSIFYPELNQINDIDYKLPFRVNNFGILFIVRAMRASFLKATNNGQTYVASSHFLPDVLPALIRGKLNHGKRVAYVHHIVQDMNRKRSVNNFLANLQEKLCLYFLKSFDSVIVINNDTRNRLIAKGFKPDNIFMSSNFVPDIDRSNIHKTRDIDISFCGRLVKQKGVYDLLWIIEELVKDGLSINASIMGIGPEKKSLSNIISKKTLPITLEGFVDENFKANKLSSSKLFLFPSYEEGWGIAIAEALSNGTNVIAYDLPAYSDAFGKSISTVKTGDKNAMLYKVKDYLNSWNHNSERYMQKKRYESVLKYTLDKVAIQEYGVIVANKK